MDEEIVLLKENPNIIPCVQCLQKFRITRLCKTRCPKCAGYPDRKEKNVLYKPTYFKPQTAPKPKMWFPQYRKTKHIVLTEAKKRERQRIYMKKYRDRTHKVIPIFLPSDMLE